MTGLPGYVQAHLINTGVMTSDRVTRKPQPRRCKKCKALVLVALEDEPPAAPRCRIHVNPTPLTPLGELQAVLIEVPTYRFTEGTLSHRTPSHIAGRPADRCIALVAHRCGITFDARPEKPTTRHSLPPVHPIPF